MDEDALYAVMAPDGSFYTATEGFDEALQAAAQRRGKK